MNRLTSLFVLLLMSFAVWGGTNIIQTVAGGGPNNMPALDANIRPWGITVDNSGNLYTFDGWTLFKVDRAGNISIVYGGGVVTAPGLAGSGGVTIDAGGNLYIADPQYKSIRKVDTGGTISTVAGDGTSGFSGDGGAATSASLNYPRGVAVDAGGNLYIADWGNHRIRKVDTTGTISTVAGNGTYGFSGDGGAATSASLSFPDGIAVDALGNLYIADGGNYRIRKVDTTGIISTVAGNGISYGFSGDGGAATSASLGNMSGVAVDAGGDLYIAGSGRIRKVDTTGTISTVAGNGTSGFSGDGGAATSASLTSPGSVAVDAGGNLYIADTENYRIRKVDTKGIISTVAGNGTSSFSGDGVAATSAGLAGPSGVAVDAGGNLYIADGDIWNIYGNSGGRIRKVDTKGIISTVAGNRTSGFSGDGGAATNASLAGHSSVAVDTGGNLYIADSGNYRIRKVDTTGTISTVAGNGISGFSGDGGVATSASLSSPGGIAVDAGGNFYIAVSGRIRKVDTKGIISTVAGIGNWNWSGIPSFSGDGGAATKASIFPGGVAVDVEGNFYIADSDNLRIRKVTMADTPPLADLNPVFLYLQNGRYTSLETTAKFTGGVALNDAGYQRYLTQPAKQGDTLTVIGTITPDAQHVGQPADIVVVGASQTVDPHEAITAPDDCDLQNGTWVWYMNTQRDNRYCNWSELPGQERYCNTPKSASVQTYWQNYWQTWTGNLYELQALDKVTLQKDTPIELTVDGRGPLYKDIIDYRNKHVCINFGYRLKDGTVVFNGDTINFRTD